MRKSLRSCWTISAVLLFRELAYAQSPLKVYVSATDSGPYHLNDVTRNKTTAALLSCKGGKFVLVAALEDADAELSISSYISNSGISSGAILTDKEHKVLWATDVSKALWWGRASSSLAKTVSDRMCREALRK